MSDVTNPQVGAEYWCSNQANAPDDLTSYYKVRVNEVSTNSVNVTDIKTKKTFDSPRNTLYICDGATDYKGKSDVSCLQATNIASVSDFLVRRLRDRSIYSTVGPILIANNPYQWIDELISPSLMNKYQSTSDPSNMEAHPWKIARLAYTRFRQNNKSQCIVMSGESGSGKTETSKLVMKFFAGGQNNPLEATNPIVEALGNASTLLNDNSSRFGRLIVLNVNKSGVATKYQIKPFLLEKSRVVFQSPGERNYHIFYQLVKGADSSEKAKYKLGQVTDYRYFSHGNDCKHKIDDAAEFQTLKKAFSLVGVPKENVEFYFKTISAILKIGNLKFELKSTDGQDGSKLTGDSMKLIEEIIELLGCKDIRERFVELLEYKIVQSRDGEIKKPMTLADSQVCADSLARALYERIFLTVIEELNDISSGAGASDSLGIKRSSSAARDFKDESAEPVIALLDIFGFECLEHNSLEQMLINLTNEQIQKFFFGVIFDHQKKLLEEEQIKFKPDLTYNSNRDIIDVIDAGVLGILGDMCGSGQAKVDAFYKSVLNLDKKIVGRTLKVKDDQFTIKHTVKDVSYEAEEFMMRNMDILPGFFVQIFQDTEDPGSHLPRLFADVPVVIGKLPKGAFIADQYKRSLVSLLDTLERSDCAFVRCIRPNDTKAKLTYVPKSAERQLEALSIIESFKALSKGFPVQQAFTDFLTINFLSAKGSASDNVRSHCTSVLGAESAETFAIGTTKVFISHNGSQKLSDNLVIRTKDLSSVCEMFENAWLFYRFKEDILQIYEPSYLRFNARARAIANSK